MWILTTRWIRRVIVFVSCLMLCAVAVCAYFRIGSVTDVIGYYQMSRAFHPVWKDLALRRIKLGDSSEELLLEHPPPLILEYGPYAEYQYEATPGFLSFSGLQITAKDGRLIGAHAGSCTWSRTFFEDQHEMRRSVVALTDDAVPKSVQWRVVHTDDN